MTNFRAARLIAGAVASVKRGTWTLTGERAAGTIRLTASTATPVEIGDTAPHVEHTFLARVRESGTGKTQVDLGAIYRIPTNIMVTQAGVVVPATAVLGGKSFNCPAGTVFKLWPRLPGIEPTATAETAFVGGTTPASDTCGTVQQVRIYEQIGTDAARALFEAKASAGANAYPALVLSWDSDGPSTPMGSNTWQHASQWTFAIITSRSDASEARAKEGADIIAALKWILNGRTMSDGEAFTHPIRVLSAKRVITTPTSYVYAVTFECEWGAVSAGSDASDADSLPAWVTTEYNVDAGAATNVALNPTKMPIVTGAVYEQDEDPTEP